MQGKSRLSIHCMEKAVLLFFLQYHNFFPPHLPRHVTRSTLTSAHRARGQHSSEVMELQGRQK